LFGRVSWIGNSIVSLLLSPYFCVSFCVFF
jgi:hypothetical protein